MMRDTLKTMLAAFGPTGQEGAVAAEITKLLSGKADSMKTDAMGNLIVEKKGRPEGKTIMLSAHMDHIALVVTDIEDTGFLRVTNVGGISLDMTKTRHVVFGNGVEGVVVCQPVKNETAGLQHLFVDIGAEDKAGAEAKVRLGDVCVYAPDCFPLGEHRMASPAMDDRCACALLCELMMQMDSPRNTIVAVFSTQEEVGLRGAACTGSRVQPDRVLVLEATTAADLDGVTGDKRVCVLGDGPVVSFMDGATIYDRALYRMARETADENGIPSQTKTAIAGGNDAGALQRAGQGSAALAVSLPCRYIHSGASVVQQSDIDATRALLAALLPKLYD